MDVIDRVQELAKETGAVIEISSDPACLKGADVIYADVWASMGEEAEIPERVRLLTPFKVTKELRTLLKIQTASSCTACLPSTTLNHYGQDSEGSWLRHREVTDEVFRSKNSVVFDEAENRMHTIKAVIVATIA